MVSSVENRDVVPFRVRQAHKGAQNLSVSGAGFLDTVAALYQNNDRVAAYRAHLEKKYGKVTIQDVPKDQESLERLGRQMGGNDVVIAPNMLEQMAIQPEKAAYYERRIDDFFRATPALKAQFAAQGLTYEPCGVVIHADGTVTCICGGGDSPERVAQVNAINKAKREKQAAQRKARERMWLEQEAERDWLAQREEVTAWLRQCGADEAPNAAWIPAASRLEHFSVCLNRRWEGFL